MLCKWCGMESVSADQCSWCHRSFAAASEEPAAEAPAVSSQSAIAETFATAPDAATGMDGASFPPELPSAEDSIDEITLVAPRRPHVEPQEPPVIAVAPPEAETVLGATVVGEPSVPFAAPAAPPQPAPAVTAATDAHATPIIPLRRPARKAPGANVPAPAMPPPSARAGAAGRLPVPISPPPPKKRAGAPGSGELPSSVAIPAAHGHTPIPPLDTSAPSAHLEAPSSRPSLPASLTGRLDTVSLADVPTHGATGPLPDLDAPSEEATAGLSAHDAAVQRIQSAEEAHVPAMGTFRPSKSRYYAGQVVDPVSGTHYDADSGAPTATPIASNADVSRGKPAADEDEVIEEGPSLAILIARFLVVYAVLLLGAAVFASRFSELAWIGLVLVQLVSGLLMPVMGAVPWHDEDSDDTFVFMVLTMAFGPFISILFYMIWGMMRQSVNAAIVGLCIVSGLTRLVVEIAARTVMNTPWMPFMGHEFSFGVMFLNWAGICGLVGWVLGNFFHKLDE